MDGSVEMSLSPTPQQELLVSYEVLWPPMHRQHLSLSPLQVATSDIQYGLLYASKAETTRSKQQASLHTCTEMEALLPRTPLCPLTGSFGHPIIGPMSGRRVQWEQSLEPDGLALWSLAQSLISLGLTCLCLSFISCTMGTMIVPLSQDHCQDYINEINPPNRPVLNKSCLSPVLPVITVTTTMLLWVLFGFTDPFLVNTPVFIRPGSEFRWASAGSPNPTKKQCRLAQPITRNSTVKENIMSFTNICWMNKRVGNSFFHSIYSRREMRLSLHLSCE